MTTQQKVGLALLIIPIPLLIIILVSYSITSFVISSSTPAYIENVTIVDTEEVVEEPVEATSFDFDEAWNNDFSNPPVVRDGFASRSGLGEATLSSTAGRLINVFLGFLGMLAVVGIIIGMPVGAILLATGGKKDPTTKTLDKKEKS
jgi:hypothetical protein